MADLKCADIELSVEGAIAFMWIAGMTPVVSAQPPQPGQAPAQPQERKVKGKSALRLHKRCVTALRNGCIDAKEARYKAGTISLDLDALNNWLDYAKEHLEAGVPHSYVDGVEEVLSKVEAAVRKLEDMVAAVGGGNGDKKS